jgi:hydroxymethylglutaryl-CoA lyase
MDRIHLVECPRDALQGWPHKVSTDDKVGYYKTLYKVGFDTLDMGSFVSPKAVPSMANTSAVIRRLEEQSIIPHPHTRTLVIIANERGASEASEFEVINDLGFPLSLSESFQQRNTGGSIEDAFKRLDSIQNICEKSKKRLVVYLSMGFGNPYGEKWHPEMLLEFSQKLHSRLGTSVIALSDTVGSANEDVIRSSFEAVTRELPQVEFGAHLHLKLLDGMGKIQAAIDGGCRRFDGAIRGIGGCPMAQDTLVGNAATERMIELFSEQGLWEPKSKSAWSQAQSQATVIFESK